MEKRIKYLEETIASLNVSFYTLQGQLFYFKHEVDENPEVNDNNVSESDECEENDQSMDESYRSEEQESKQTPKRKTESRYEDLMYWVNKGKNNNNLSPKDKTNKREFSVEDLKRWSNIGRSRSESMDVTSDEIKSPQNNKNGNNLKCEQCKYRCKRKQTMNKHLSTKHREVRGGQSSDHS